MAGRNRARLYVEAGDRRCRFCVSKPPRIEQFEKVVEGVRVAAEAHVPPRGDRLAAAAVVKFSLGQDHADLGVPPVTVSLRDIEDGAITLRQRFDSAWQKAQQQHGIVPMAAE